MDFLVAVLSADDEEVRRRARSFLAENVSEEALRREHEIGAGLIEELHLALHQPLLRIRLPRRG
jgi:hypothetical protein